MKNFFARAVFFFPLIFLGIGAADLWAQLTPLFGPEFTFTNVELIEAANKTGSHIVNTDVSEKKRDELKDAVTKKCPDCQVKTYKDKYGVINHKVTHPSGLWFNISTDPSVIEIQMKPLTLQEIKDQKNLIQGLIFNTAKDVGIIPDESKGGGHIHMDLKSAFKDDSLLFLNFFTDYQNHPGIGHGVLEMDVRNAPVLGNLDVDQRANYERILENFKATNQSQSIAHLTKKISNRIYHKNFAKWTPPEKYQALNLSRINDPKIAEAERTIEIRSVRAQKDVDEYIKEATLFQARLNFLRGKKDVIPYINKTYFSFNYRYNQFVVDNFHHYVTEMGLPWDDYKDLLPSTMDHLVPTALKVAPCEQQDAL